MRVWGGVCACVSSVLVCVYVMLLVLTEICSVHMKAEKDHFVMVGSQVVLIISFLTLFCTSRITVAWVYYDYIREKQTRYYKTYFKSKICVEILFSKEVEVKWPQGSAGKPSRSWLHWRYQAGFSPTLSRDHVLRHLGFVQKHSEKIETQHFTEV